LQNLKRQWLGIDISPTACRVMAPRIIVPLTVKEILDGDIAQKLV
jgi:hypothetical protein